MRLSSKLFRFSGCLITTKEANGEFCHGESDPDDPCRDCTLKCRNGIIDTTIEIKKDLKKVKRITH
jgi:hypothetical protein